MAVPEAPPPSSIQPYGVIESADGVTEVVLRAMAGAPDARLREVIASLVHHLHSFAREVRLTQDEYDAAIDFLNRVGQATHAAHNEGILLADALGLSTLVCLLNNGNHGATEAAAALLGPFWRDHAPLTANGGSIVRSPTSGPALFVNGRITDPAGRPIPAVEVDVWQASPIGLYENQDPDQADMNLRARFHTHEDGRFWFRSVKPAGYPVPVDGPTGELLRAQRRHPFRPAHLHVLAYKPGFTTLITQVFVDDDEYLGSDVVFGVTRHLIGDYRRHDARASAGSRRRGALVFARLHLRHGAGRGEAAGSAHQMRRMSAMKQPLARCVALIVGGGGGIGAATARLYAEAGARVIIAHTPRSAEAAKSLVAILPGGGHLTHVVDVTDSALLRRLREAVEAQCGPALHVLVNASGFTKPVPHANLDGLDDELIDRMFAVNWRGQFATIRTFAPMLKASAGGLVVSISSIAGQTGIGSSIAYCAAKAGIDVMTKSLARVLAPDVRVMAVAPGVVDTSFVPGRDASFNANTAATTPLRRIATPDDVAEAVLACATSLRFATGTTIVVDGGRSL